MLKQILRELIYGGQVQVQEPQPEPVVTITIAKPDFAQDIIGHEKLIELVKKVSHSSGPIHLMFNGPPSCGKTAICKAFFEYNKDISIWLEGDQTTIEGLIQEIQEKPQVKFIIYNEIGDAKPRVRQALLELLENGTIKKTTKSDPISINHPVWLIATTNSIESMTKQFLSRFIVKSVNAYTSEQFIQVGTFMAKKQGVPQEVAEHIAEIVLTKFGLTQLRKVRDLARMSKTTEDADANIELM